MYWSSMIEKLPSDMFFMPYFAGPLLGFAAAITGFIARRQINKNIGNKEGENIAVFGIALGLISIFLTGCIIVFWIFIVATSP
jgi:hypothetical protein